MRITLTLDISRRTTERDLPTAPEVYDTAPAMVERDPSLDVEEDFDVRRRPRIGFQPAGGAL